MILAEKEVKSTPKTTENTVLKVHGFASPVTPVNSRIPPHQEVHPHEKQKFSKQFYHWWHRIAVVLLSIYGLVGIWESIRFIAIDFKKLEQQLDLHQVQVEEVNSVIALAVIVAFTTLINIFMAFRLNKTEETTAHNIDLFIATILIIGTKYIQQTLIQFDLLNIFINSF
ncbi:hypothetical protein KKD03_02295 [Patescibacteria group bacterium]|nr:hypothetical protein [Patescibacteria group bacterium]